MKKHTTIVEISDYKYEDLVKAVSDNCEMKNLFWPQKIEAAVHRISQDFYLDLKSKTVEEQIDYIKSYFGWALFIGICMGADQKARITRHEEGIAC